MAAAQTRSCSRFAGAVAIAFWIVLALVAHHAAAQTPGTAVAKPEIVLSGVGVAARTVTAAELQALPRVTYQDKREGATVQYEGVQLHELLKLVNAPAGKEIRGDKLSWIVSVKAADGYRAVFALAEIDPAFSDRTIILADRKDGLALPAAEGPFRIVAGGDKRPARWVRQVISISLQATP